MSKNVPFTSKKYIRTQLTVSRHKAPADGTTNRRERTALMLLADSVALLIVVTFVVFRFDAILY